MAASKSFRRLLGVRIDNVDLDQSVAIIGDWVGGQNCHQIVTVGTEFIMKARRDPEFKQTLEQADLALADGIGPVWFSRLTGPALKARVTGVDLSYKLAQQAASNGWRLFLVGSNTGLTPAQTAAEVLTKKYPGLTIAGTIDASQNDIDLVDRINQADADIVLVAWGAPAQDSWIAANRGRLQAGVAIGVGGSFDFISGQQHRAPQAWQKLGLEWLWRLIHQPQRLWRMLDIPVFMVLMAGEAIFKRSRVDA